MKFGQMYTHGAADPAGVVQSAVGFSLVKQVKFDTIVGTGLSGSLVIPMLARRLRRKWAIVRKDGEQRHSSYQIEGEIGDRWIFVDDLIASGRTLRRVQEVVQEEFRIREAQTTYVGAWLYATPHWREG